MRNASIIDERFNNNTLVKAIILGMTLFFLLISAIRFSSGDDVIYTSNNLIFYYDNDVFVVVSGESGGIYDNTGEQLKLSKSIIGSPDEIIEFDSKNKTIANKKYRIFKRLNNGFYIKDLFKNNFFLADISSIENISKEILDFKNVLWASENILGKERMLARIVNDTGESLVDICFSEKGKIESVRIKNKEKNIPAIKSFFNLLSAKKLNIIETNQGNTVFLALDGTISAIKNKINGDIEYYEVRLYGSSGLYYIENFLTDFENSKK